MNKSSIEILPDFIKENSFFSTYPSSKMIIILTKKPTYLLKGEYRHLNYEFILTQSPVYDFMLDGEKMNIAPQMLFAINTWQLHGTQNLISGVSFISVQFNKDFLHQLAYEIYGIREIQFSNIPIPFDNELIEMLKMYIKEHEQKREGYFYILDNLSIQIAVKLFRKIKILNPRVEEAENFNIGKVIACFKENFADDFSFETISEVSNMSKFKLIRKFKDSTGMTPYEHFMEIRIMKALEYLNKPSYKIIDVAFMCGFKNHSHFSKVFKAKTGLSPNEYRKKILHI